MLESQSHIRDCPPLQVKSNYGIPAFAPRSIRVAPKPDVSTVISVGLIQSCTLLIGRWNNAVNVHGEWGSVAADPSTVYAMCAGG
jgi:hypothetical protein